MKTLTHLTASLVTLITLAGAAAAQQIDAMPYGVSGSARQAIAIDFVPAGTFDPAENAYLRITGAQPNTLGVIFASAAPDSLPIGPQLDLLVDMSGPVIVGSLGFGADGSEECFIQYCPELQGMVAYVQVFGQDANGQTIASHGMEVTFN